MNVRYDEETQNVLQGDRIIGNYKRFGVGGAKQAAVYCRMHQCRKVWRQHNAPSVEDVLAWFARGLETGSGKGYQRDHMRSVPVRG